MIQRYDLIIAGGSFAGLACARTAALRGLKVAVIDAKPEPGARVRTTGIMVMKLTIHNQKGELVCDGEHKYLVKKRPQ